MSLSKDEPVEGSAMAHRARTWRGEPPFDRLRVTSGFGLNPDVILSLSKDGLVEGWACRRMGLSKDGLVEGWGGGASPNDQEPLRGGSDRAFWGDFEAFVA